MSLWIDHWKIPSASAFDFGDTCRDQFWSPAAQGPSLLATPCEFSLSSSSLSRAMSIWWRRWWPRVGYQWAYKTCWILVVLCDSSVFDRHQPSIRILGGFITWKKTDLHFIVPGKGRSKTPCGIFSDSVVKALLLGAKGPWHFQAPWWTSGSPTRIPLQQPRTKLYSTQYWHEAN